MMPKSYAVFDVHSRLCIEKDDAKDASDQISLIAREGDRACYVKLDDYALRELAVHCAVLYEARTRIKLTINTSNPPKTIERHSPPGLENVKPVFPADKVERVGSGIRPKPLPLSVDEPELPLVPPAAPIPPVRIRQRVPIAPTPVVPARVRVRQPV